MLSFLQSRKLCLVFHMKHRPFKGVFSPFDQSPCFNIVLFLLYNKWRRYKSLFQFVVNISSTVFHKFWILLFCFFFLLLGMWFHLCYNVTKPSITPPTPSRSSKCKIGIWCFCFLSSILVYVKTIFFCFNSVTSLMLIYSKLVSFDEPTSFLWM